MPEREKEATAQMVVDALNAAAPASPAPASAERENHGVSFEEKSKGSSAVRHQNGSLVGELLVIESGEWVWIPDHTSRGYLPAHVIRAIADECDRRNAPLYADMDANFARLPHTVQPQPAGAEGVERPPMLLAKPKGRKRFFWYLRTIDTGLWYRTDLPVMVETSQSFTAVDRTRSDPAALEIYDRDRTAAGSD